MRTLTPNRRPSQKTNFLGSTKPASKQGGKREIAFLHLCFFNRGRYRSHDRRKKFRLVYSANCRARSAKRGQVALIGFSLNNDGDRSTLR